MHRQTPIPRPLQPPHVRDLDDHEIKFITESPPPLVRVAAATTAEQFGLRLEETTTEPLVWQQTYGDYDVEDLLGHSPWSTNRPLAGDRVRYDTEIQRLRQRVEADKGIHERGCTDVHNNLSGIASPFAAPIRPIPLRQIPSDKLRRTKVPVYLADFRTRAGAQRQHPQQQSATSQGGEPFGQAVSPHPLDATQEVAPASAQQPRSSSPCALESSSKPETARARTPVASGRPGDAHKLLGVSGAALETVEENSSVSTAIVKQASLLGPVDHSQFIQSPPNLKHKRTSPEKTHASLSSAGAISKSSHPSHNFSPASAQDSELECESLISDVTERIAKLEPSLSRALVPPNGRPDLRPSPSLGPRTPSVGAAGTIPTPQMSPRPTPSFLLGSMSTPELALMPSLELGQTNPNTNQIRGHQMHFSQSSREGRSRVGSRADEKDSMYSPVYSQMMDGYGDALDYEIDAEAQARRISGDAAVGVDKLSINLPANDSTTGKMTYTELLQHSRHISTKFLHLLLPRLPSPVTSPSGADISLNFTVHPASPPASLFDGQAGRCAHCHRALINAKLSTAAISPSAGSPYSIPPGAENEPSKYHYCAYTGRLVCISCASPHKHAIPGRLLALGDAQQYPVSSLAYEFLSAIWCMPIIIPSLLNYGLYFKHPVLRRCQKMRYSLAAIARDISPCPIGSSLLRSFFTAETFEALIPGQGVSVAPRPSTRVRSMSIESGSNPVSPSTGSSEVSSPRSDYDLDLFTRDLAPGEVVGDRFYMLREVSPSMAQKLLHEECYKIYRTLVEPSKLAAKSRKPSTESSGAAAATISATDPGKGYRVPSLGAESLLAECTKIQPAPSEDRHRATSIDLSNYRVVASPTTLVSTPSSSHLKSGPSLSVKTSASVSVGPGAVAGAVTPEEEVVEDALLMTYGPQGRGFFEKAQSALEAAIAEAAEAEKRKAASTLDIVKGWFSFGRSDPEPQPQVVSSISSILPGDVIGYDAVSISLCDDAGLPPLTLPSRHLCGNLTATTTSFDQLSDVSRCTVLGDEDFSPLDRLKRIASAYGACILLLVSGAEMSTSWSYPPARLVQRILRLAQESEALNTSPQSGGGRGPFTTRLPRLRPAEFTQSISTFPLAYAAASRNLPLPLLARDLYSLRDLELLFTDSLLPHLYRALGSAAVHIAAARSGATSRTCPCSQLKLPDATVPSGNLYCPMKHVTPASSGRMSPTASGCCEFPNDPIYRFAPLPHPLLTDGRTPDLLTILPSGLALALGPKSPYTTLVRPPLSSECRTCGAVYHQLCFDDLIALGPHRVLDSVKLPRSFSSDDSSNRHMPQFILPDYMLALIPALLPSDPGTQTQLARAVQTLTQRRALPHCHVCTSRQRALDQGTTPTTENSRSPSPSLTPAEGSK